MANRNCMGTWMRGLSVLLCAGLISACGEAPEPEATDAEAAAEHPSTEEHPSTGEVAVPAEVETAPAPTRERLPGFDQVQGIPSSFPTDFPQYPGSSLKEAHEGPQGAVAVFTSPDSPAQIETLMKEELEGAGWKLDASEAMGNGIFIAATKDTNTVSVFVSQEAGGLSEIEAAYLPFSEKE